MHRPTVLPGEDPIGPFVVAIEEHRLTPLLHRRGQHLVETGLAARLQHRTRPAPPPPTRRRNRPEDLDFHDPLRRAVIYPETVALTAILASRYWRRKILDRRPQARPARLAFHAEFTRPVTPHHHQHDLVERLIQEHLTDPDRRYRAGDRWP
jgi:hypothetical protein